MFTFTLHLESRTTHDGVNASLLRPRLSYIFEAQFDGRNKIVPAGNAFTNPNPARVPRPKWAHGSNPQLRGNSWPMPSSAGHLLPALNVAAILNLNVLAKSHHNSYAIRILFCKRHTNRKLFVCLALYV